MTSKRMEDFGLLNSGQLAMASRERDFDTSCLRENVLFSLRAINSSNERLDITLFEYNYLPNRTPIARILHPFFSLGKLVVFKMYFRFTSKAIKVILVF